MLVAAEQAAHPFWHLAIVAVGAPLSFVVVVAVERTATWRAARRDHVREPRQPLPFALKLLALASAFAGLIHAAACPEHFREASLFGAFFLVSAVAQVIWALLVLSRPTSWLLATGVALNAVIILLWVMSRTSGLPVGPDPWVREAIGAPDAIATLCELALVGVAGRLLTGRRSCGPGHGIVAV
jgi:hypothetical protein